MEAKKLAELTDQELLQAAKKMKSTAITNGFLIGFLAGIIVFSVAKNTWGFLTLIPLVLIFKLVNTRSPYSKEEVERLLVERKLK